MLDLLDSVKKRHAQFDLIEHLEYLFHEHVFIVVPKPIRKRCYRLVNLISSCMIDLRPAHKIQYFRFKNRMCKVLNSTTIASGYASRDPQGGTSDESF